MDVQSGLGLTLIHSMEQKLSSNFRKQFVFNLYLLSFNLNKKHMQNYTEMIRQCISALTILKQVLHYSMFLKHHINIENTNPLSSFNYDSVLNRNVCLIMNTNTSLKNAIATSSIYILSQKQTLLLYV